MAGATMVPFVLLLAVTTVSGSAMPNDVKVCVGEGVRIRATEILGVLTKCDVYSPSKAHFSLLPSKNGILRGKGTEPIYWDSGIEGERCGFRLDEVSMQDRGDWKLSVQSSTNTTVNSTVKVYPFDCDVNLDRQYVINAGEKKFFAQCGDEESMRCLFNKPEGDGKAKEGDPPPKRAKACSMNGSFDSLDNGVWTCDWATDKSLKKRSSKMTLTQKPIITVDTKELSEEVAMLCAYTGPTAIFQTCRWVKPGGEELYPRDGLILGRYAYYGSGIYQDECGIAIKKPLEEADKGVWRCEFYSNNENTPAYGAYVELGIERRNRAQKLSTLRKWAGDWKKGGEELALGVAGQPLTIGCSLYSPLSFCQIVHPNGSRIEPKDGLVAPYGNGHELGDCGFTLLNPSTKDTGIWKCMVGVEYGDAAVSLIDVRVYESELAAVNLDSARASGGASLHCETVFGVALEHCRFQRPDGSMFSVADSGSPEVDSMLSETGIRSVGNLSEGICSVTLPTVRSSDIGVWRCIGRIAGMKSEVTAKFSLRAKAVTAASIGMITGIIVAVFAVLGVGAVVFVKIRRRHAAGLLTGLPRPQQHQENIPPMNYRRSSDEDETS